MEITLPISSFIIIGVDSVGVIISLTLSIALIAQKNKKHRSVYLFSLLLLLTGLTLLNDMFSISGLSNRFPDLYFLPIFYSLSIGPLFYLLVKSKRQIELKAYDLLHLILPIGQALIILVLDSEAQNLKVNFGYKHLFPPILKSNHSYFP